MLSEDLSSDMDRLHRKYNIVLSDIQSLLEQKKMHEDQLHQLKLNLAELTKEK